MRELSGQNYVSHYVFLVLEMLKLIDVSSTVACFAAVNENIPWGSIVCIDGRNGIGKTTLLRIICGISIEYLGNVIYDEYDVRQYAVELQHYLQAVFSGGIYNHITARQNIALWSYRWSGMNISTAALKFFDIECYGDYKISELSLGTCRKIALARLLACPSRLWIVDEADIYLDKISKQRLCGLFQNHAMHGGTVIFTSNDPDFKTICGKNILLQSQMPS